MTPWYVKVFWWTLGIWALGALVLSGDDSTPYPPNHTIPYNAYEEALQPDNLCPTGPC